MGRINLLLADNPISGFLLLTFIISLISLVLMLNVSGAHTPESSIGLPIWLIAIWSPNIAAIIIWSVKKELLSKLQTSFSIPDFSWWQCVSLLPLVIAGAILILELQRGHVIQWSNFELKSLIPLLLINLFLGPLGEELGWRGLLYPEIKSNYGWMASALIVGAIWSLWHAPLWLLDSPQSKIPFWAFSLNVVLLSMLMGIIYNHSQGSIIAIVILHLTFNVSLGIIDVLGSHQPGEFVIKSLYLYVPLVLILVGIHEVTGLHTCRIQ
ncbi:type II CAAX endopeptidase family protein [uncultured Roseivirga sp.]|uniref:CPBP family intramembrane glutamic endopeptidase n=1 Tax=uncultured Roseivirga sp. TaxID=543088 RepID=UPI0032B1BD2A